MKYFSEFDTNDDGQLSTQELVEGYQRVGAPLRAVELETLMALVEAHPTPRWWAAR